VAEMRRDAFVQNVRGFTCSLFLHFCLFQLEKFSFTLLFKWSLITVCDLKKKETFIIEQTNELLARKTGRGDGVQRGNTVEATTMGQFSFPPKENHEGGWVILKERDSGQTIP
jgi:hypothetical protein